MNIRRNNTLGLVGFILACVSLIMTPLLIVGLAACILSGIGLVKFNPETETNKWMPIAGLIIGVISLVLGLITWVFLGAFFAILMEELMYLIALV